MMFARHRLRPAGSRRGATYSGIAALAVGALILTGCGGDGGEAAEPDGRKQTPAQQTAAREPRLSSIGEEVVADGITLVVDEVTARDDFRTGTGGSATEKAARGKTFAFVHTTVENTGDGDISPVCGDVIATLTDDDGTHDTVGAQRDYVANPGCAEAIEPGDDDIAIFIFEVDDDAEPDEFHFRLRDHGDDAANTVAIDDVGDEPGDRRAHSSRSSAAPGTTRRTAPRQTTTRSSSTPRTSATRTRECEDGEPGGYDYSLGGYLTCVDGHWEVVPGPPPPDGLYPPEDPPQPPAEPADPEQPQQPGNGGTGEGGGGGGDGSGGEDGVGGEG